VARWRSAGSTSVELLELRAMQTKHSRVKSCLRGWDWFGPPRSNTLRPVSSCRVLALDMFVVGVIIWSGVGIEPKSLGCECLVHQPS
jgi:hypothetical protein